MTTRNALPFDWNAGGLPGELLVPDPQAQITITRVSGVSFQGWSARDRLAMNENRYTVDQFRRVASRSLRFLEEGGFCRTSSFEETSPTRGTIVYLGKHVGFVFSLDVRDQCVDAQVVKVQDGVMVPLRKGGYSSNLFSHLAKYSGFRGRPLQPRLPGTALEATIDGWASLLQQAGKQLLADRLDSIPK